MLLFRFVIGDTAASEGLTGAELAAEGEFQKFLLGSGLCMSVGMVASMVPIYGIAEEKEKRALCTLMLANVSVGEAAASKGGVALAAVVAVGTACFAVAGGDPALLPAYLALTADSLAPMAVTLAWAVAAAAVFAALYRRFAQDN